MKNKKEKLPTDEEIEQIQKRANLWHKWVSKNCKNAYNGLGVISDDIMVKYDKVCEDFMSGKRIK